MEHIYRKAEPGKKRGRIPNWKCDEVNGENNNPYCINPNHVTINITEQETSRESSKTNLFAKEKIMQAKTAIVDKFKTTSSKRKDSVASRVSANPVQFCEIIYHRFANVLESNGNLRFKGYHMNHDYQPSENESTGGRPGYKIRVRPDKSSAMLTGDNHNPSNLERDERDRKLVCREAFFNLMYSEKPISDLRTCTKKLLDGNTSHQKCTKKGAEERTCHFSHRHCSKPIYRFDIRLESEPKNPAPNFFNFPEKKLDFTIDNLDNNGNEYIYVSVPLVAFKELPDYIKGNANYQFESHPVLYYKLPRGRKMSCFKPNENLAELIREIIQHREESQNDLDLNQTTVASLLWQASSFIVLIEWNKDPTNKKPVLQFEKVDLNRQKMTELQIPEYVDIVALSSRCDLSSIEYIEVKSTDVYNYTHYLIENAKQRTNNKPPDSDSIEQSGSPEGSVQYI